MTRLFQVISFACLFIKRNWGGGGTLTGDIDHPEQKRDYVDVETEDAWDFGYIYLQPMQIYRLIVVLISTKLWSGATLTPGVLQRLETPLLT